MDGALRHERLDETALERDGRFWEIYAQAFAASEKEPREVILESVRRKTGMVFRTLLDGRTVALATTHALRKIPALFLVYLAVDPELRSRGAGGSLLEHLHQASGQLVPGSLGMVWETERAEDAGPGPARALRERRLEFFRRHGASVVSGSYRQPALDGVAPVPMNLLFRPAEPGQDIGPVFARALARSIYEEKYQALNGVSWAHLEDLLAGKATPRPPWP
ncbi:MAG TPA: GNAT family N-acetyltransferase [Humidesulfovibrio sp.]|uniref:GNAT family N-acetyltransferase n=1 Tax=Humidesulfovibrio sp. TaxID=2910988 RepID=UPI002CB273EC|nr:GNAT family N-acetyltransferase [Humidesulfovibrio sp.]HWR04049.1 GNAT family N-acetyltransferase [Humidesulfovibrio sp.]